MDYLQYSFFCFGVVFGMIIYHLILMIEDKIYIRKNFKTPLEDLNKRNLNDFKFLWRQGITVCLTLDTDKYLYLYLDNREIALFQNKEKILSTNKKLKSEFDLFYSKMNNHFNKEIHVDIIEHNNIIYSNNVNFVNVEIKNKKEFLLDEILEKIHVNGLESLTDKEKEFLNKQSENDKEN